MKTKYNRNIPVDKYDEPLYFFDCEFCKGYLLVKLKEGEELTIEEAQEFHESGHKADSLIIIGKRKP